MTALDIRHGHSSGRYDRSPLLLEGLLDEMMSSHDVLTGTEVSGKPRTSRLRERGWHHYSGHHGDADALWFAWDRLVWSAETLDETEVTNHHYYRAGGAAAPPNAIVYGVLKHNLTGKRLLVTVGHYPAGIEGHGGPFGIYNALQRRVGVHLSAVRGTIKVKHALARKYNPDAVLVGGDWNLNYGRADVRAFFKVMFPHATGNFSTFPAKGTLGKRFIDIFFLWGLKVIDGPHIHDTKASDHRWYSETLELP